MIRCRVSAIPGIRDQATVDRMPGQAAARLAEARAGDPPLERGDERVVAGRDAGCPPQGQGDRLPPDRGEAVVPKKPHPLGAVGPRELLPVGAQCQTYMRIAGIGTTPRKRRICAIEHRRRPQVAGPAEGKAPASEGPGCWARRSGRGNRRRSGQRSCQQRDGKDEDGPDKTKSGNRSRSPTIRRTSCPSGGASLRPAKAPA